jgi:uncharacterized coiled-coil protein SlyX
VQSATLQRLTERVTAQDVAIADYHVTLEKISEQLGELKIAVAVISAGVKR